jgi:hypothetical protein
MNAFTVVSPIMISDLPVVTWTEAIKPFPDTLNSPQTRRAYRAAIAEARQSLAAASSR